MSKNNVKNRINKIDIFDLESILKTYHMKVRITPDFMINYKDVLSVLEIDDFRENKPEYIDEFEFYYLAINEANFKPLKYEIKSKLVGLIRKSYYRCFGRSISDELLEEYLSSPTNIKKFVEMVRHSLTTSNFKFY